MLAPLCSFVLCMCSLIYMCSDSLFGEIDLCSTSDQLRARVASLTTTSRYLARITPSSVSACGTFLAEAESSCNCNKYFEFKKLVGRQHP